MDDNMIAVHAERKAATLDLIVQNAENFRADFRSWLDANWPIWVKFEQMALEVAARREHYSAKTLFEVIRHHTLLHEHGSAWKLNNVYTADCARLFGVTHPRHAQLFATRHRPACAA